MDDPVTTAALAGAGGAAGLGVIKWLWRWIARPWLAKKVGQAAVRKAEKIVRR